MIMNRNDLYPLLPESVNGYELAPVRGYFSIIVPESTINLVINPSVEGGITTGYAAVGGAMAAISTWQAYGQYGLQLTPAVSTESGFYFGTVALGAGTTYTASATIQGEAGKIYYIWIGSTAGALVGTKRAWIGTGHKQRIHVTTMEPTGASRRVYVTRDGKYTDQHLFYADGLQVEAKAYPTTYADGDQLGLVPALPGSPAPYYWTGTRLASTSVRSAQTRAGGREMSLLEYGLKILVVLGLGMAVIVDQSLPLPGLGALPQGTGTTTRDFTLVAALYSSDSGGRLLQALRSDLIDAVKPDRVTIDQPLILRYQMCDADGEVQGESLDIICKYTGGLEGNWDNHQQERISLSFRMYLPMIRSAYASGTVLGYQTAIANSNYILMRSPDGVWQKLSTGADNTINVVKFGPDGYLYAGGSFTNIGGVAANRIAFWNGAAWGAMSVGVDGMVNAIDFDYNGDPCIAGAFTHDGGGVNLLHNLARFTGGAWVDDGDPSLGVVNNMRTVKNTVGPYPGHRYYIASENGAWVMTDSGNMHQLGAIIHVDDVMMPPNGVLMATSHDPAVDVNGTTYEWIGGAWVDSLAGIGGPLVYDAHHVYTGRSYSGGTAATVKQYGGSRWKTLGSFNINPDPAGSAEIRVLVVHDNLLYAAGRFASVNYGASSFLAAPGGPLLIFTGSTWIPADITLPAGAYYINSIAFAQDGSLVIASNGSGTAYSATVSTPNVGSATTYPVITFTGPGTLYQVKNYTTGRSIFFNLTLLRGEIAVLNLDPMNLSFKSNLRGNIFSTILPGSNISMPLLPGINNVSAYMYGSTTAETAMGMNWYEQYWSIDGAAWK